MGKDKEEGNAALIISYDCVLRDIVTRMLRYKGYRVVNRSVGFHGIRTFQKGKNKFDIVIIDTELPDMSGLSVAKKIKEANRVTPTVLLRGRKKGAEEKEMRGACVDLTIRKPLFMDRIFELIENVIASAEKFNAK